MQTASDILNVDSSKPIVSMPTRILQLLLAEITELRRDAALVKAERERAWQPIETAPRDGTLVILSGAGRVTAGAWYEWEGTEDVEGGANWSDWYGGFTDEHPATQWMPLPSNEQVR